LKAVESQGEEQSRKYYDQFAKGYDDKRGGNEPGGYHDLLDDLEVETVRRFGEGKDVLEVGCGTGLLLTRFSDFARSAKGIDLSPGMLEKAKARGLDVVEGSATALPFADQSFDVACSFKVLAHIPDISAALSEMLRVVRPGGYVIAEFYNPWSLRYAAKKAAGARKTSGAFKEDAVFTRFDSPFSVRDRTPAGATLVATRGIRIVTPAAFVMSLPIVSGALRAVEVALADSPLKQFAGFYVAIWQRDR
jgi:ubiquinone/menaquinone biosynthesis C-methylase UbiE